MGTRRVSTSSVRRRADRAARRAGERNIHTNEGLGRCGLDLVLVFVGFRHGSRNSGLCRNSSEWLGRRCIHHHFFMARRSGDVIVVAQGLWQQEPFYLQASKLHLKDRSSPIALPSATSLARTRVNLKTASQNHGGLCLKIRTKFEQRVSLLWCR